MKIQHFKRIFPWLLAVSVGIMLYSLSGEHINWTFISGKTKHTIDVTSPPVLHTTNKSISGTVKTHPSTQQTDRTVTRDTTTIGTGGSLRETVMPMLFKKDFKKIPQWDFDDVYMQDGQPMHTTCAQSLRKSEDESFKKAFIPNIRLYMHKDNVNIKEWNRLSHFNNPFGFMQYNYSEVKPALNVIPKPKEPLLPPKTDGDGCVRCAVVASGGILYGSGKGKEIDAHDYVFRMNGAVINGFEDDVGNRTSVYLHTFHSIRSSLRIFGQYGMKEIPHDEGIKYVHMPEDMRDYPWLHRLLTGNRTTTTPGSYSIKWPWTYYSGRFNESRFYVLHPDFLRYVKNRFLKFRQLNSSHWDIIRPTNGAFTLFLALHTCDVVSAYGFMTEDYKNYSSYYAHRGAQTRVFFWGRHDYRLEMRTWKKLHDAKIINLYQRNETQNEQMKNSETTRT